MILWISFFIAACIYSAAGFGGASAYTAIMVLSGHWEQDLIRNIAFICNILVVSQGFLIAYRHQRISRSTIQYLLIGSIPGIILGSQWQLTEVWFLLILSGILILSAGALVMMEFLQFHCEISDTTPKSPNQHLLIFLGSAAGLLGGISGIGGGILIAPFLHKWHWCDPEQIPGVTSTFILINSLIGICFRLSSMQGLVEQSQWLWLPLAVILGGLLGATFLHKKMQISKVRYLTAAILLFAAFQLLRKVLSLT